MSTVKPIIIKKRQMNLIPINIISVLGAYKHRSDFSLITVFEGDVLTISAEIAIPDRSFSVPIRSSDGSVQLFEANVANGMAQVQLRFDSSGVYHYTKTEANLEMPEPVFTLIPVQIDVLKKLE